jgi:hypothetical protein
MADPKSATRGCQARSSEQGAAQGQQDAGRVKNLSPNTQELWFAMEKLRDIMSEVRPLWTMHYAETEGYRQQPMKPDEAQFLRMEESGMWRQFTARNAVGALVGHMGFIVHTNRHTSTKTAVEDYFYLLPEHRAGFNAVRFLRYVIGQLKAEQCAQIGMSSKLTNDITPLLKRVGFKHVANFFVLT